jgi:NADH dehydrogenase
MDANKIPRVVIVGGGFGGLEAARQLRKAAVQVTLIDRRNFHLFQPLLYQVATAGLSPANIATPLRYIVRHQRNCEVLLADVIGFDVSRRVVLLADGEVSYDTLILAAGASHSYFGRDDWAEFAPGLKTLEQATEIRRRILTAFEQAEREADLEQRRALLTFTVIGGGPTGVELAGAISEIARHTLAYDFRHINPADARVVLVEAGPRVLAQFPEELSQRGAKKIRDLGIELLTGHKVVDIQADRVSLLSAEGTIELRTRTVLWGAGVQANPLARKLADAIGAKCDNAGRIPVQNDQTLAGYPELFVIGDISRALDAEGKPLPGLAPVAMQQGQYVARQIMARIQSSSPLPPFRYRNRGTMATIGRSAAVAQLGSWTFCGFLAWLMWLFVHLMLIVQFQNRLLVLMQWLWCYATHNRSARLITGDTVEPAKQM